MNHKKGFTLIELIIGITILVVGISAVLSLVLFSIQLNKENMVKVQALELAREGLEIMRNIRDSNWKNNYPFAGGDERLWGETWNDENGKTIIVSPLFREDFYPWKVQSVFLPNQKEYTRLYLSPIGEISVYTHDSDNAVPSRFYRYITITPDTAYMNTDTLSSDKITITCYVLWDENGREKKVELSEILTNWKKI